MESIHNCSSYDASLIYETKVLIVQIRLYASLTKVWIQTILKYTYDEKRSTKVNKQSVYKCTYLMLLSGSLIQTNILRFINISSNGSNVKYILTTINSAHFVVAELSKMKSNKTQVLIYTSCCHQ